MIMNITIIIKNGTITMITTTNKNINTNKID